MTTKSILRAARNLQTDQPASASPLTTTEPQLTVRGLWKIFGTSTSEFARIPDHQRSPADLTAQNLTPAVQDADFDVHTGEVFVIMGLSGSGKSTLLRCLTRLIEPTAGRIMFGGTDICAADATALRNLRRERMGMVFQNFALLPNRTVLGNIAFPLEIQGVPRDQVEAQARRLIETVGLGGRENRYPSELSGGQQQRIGIARSLMTEPDLWMLDEPFSALDPLIRADLQDEVLRLQDVHRRTVVFVTHDLDEAIKLADRIAIMEHGRIVQIGTAEKLVTEPANDYVRRFVAKIAPSDVVRVESLMRPVIGDALAAEPVSMHATISSIGVRLIDGPNALPVVDESGQRVGTLDRSKALSVLAGKR